jgi:hypothetical protein
MSRVVLALTATQPFNPEVLDGKEVLRRSIPAPNELHETRNILGRCMVLVHATEIVCFKGVRNDSNDDP